MSQQEELLLHRIVRWPWGVLVSTAQSMYHQPGCGEAFAIAKALACNGARDTLIQRLAISMGVFEWKVACARSRAA